MAMAYAFANDFDYDYVPKAGECLAAAALVYAGLWVVETPNIDG